MSGHLNAFWRKMRKTRNRSRQKENKRPSEIQL